MQVQNLPIKSTTSNAHFEKCECHKKKPVSAKVKIASLAGSSVGIATTMGLLLYNLKKGGVSAKLKNIEFVEKDVLKLGGASILGGLTGGLLTDKKENRKPKIREAMQQFFGNIVVPVSVLGINLALLKKSQLKMPLLNQATKFAKNINPLLKETPRILVTIASLVGGLELGNRIMNKVNDKIFHEKGKREVKASDYSAHVDDICFASTFIFKNPKFQSIISRILPASYLIAGFETGIKGKD